MNADDVLKVVMNRLGGGMPLVDIQTELAGVLLDLSGRADFLTAVQAIETVAGQAAYELAENCKSVHEVFIENGCVLEKKTYCDYLVHLGSDTKALAEPRYYALRHGKMILWPVPDVAYTIYVDGAVYHPETFTDILFGAEFNEAIYEGTLAAVYAGQLNRQLALAQRTLAEQEQLTFRFYEANPMARRHRERYEKEIEKLIGIMEADAEAAIVEYRDV
jgi:hypothetical protein